MGGKSSPREGSTGSGTWSPRTGSAMEETGWFCWPSAVPMAWAGVADGLAREGDGGRRLLLFRQLPACGWGYRWPAAVCRPGTGHQQRRTGGGRPGRWGRGLRFRRWRRCCFAAAGRRGLLLFVFFFGGQIFYPVKEHSQAGVGGDEQAGHAQQKEDHDGPGIGQGFGKQDGQRAGDQAAGTPGRAGGGQLDDAVQRQRELDGTVENMEGTAPEHGQHQGGEDAQPHLAPALDDEQSSAEKQAEGQQNKAAANGAGDQFFQPFQQEALDIQQGKQAKQGDDRTDAGIELPPRRDLLAGGAFFLGPAGRGGCTPLFAAGGRSAAAARAAARRGFLVLRGCQMGSPAVFQIEWRIKRARTTRRLVFWRFRIQSIPSIAHLFLSASPACRWTRDVGGARQRSRWRAAERHPAATRYGCRPSRPSVSLDP